MPQRGMPRRSKTCCSAGVVDRGMRLLLLTPFRTEAGDYILDPGVYVTCLEDLGARLEARGLTLGETFSCLETGKRPPPPLGGRGWCLPCWGLAGVPLVQTAGPWLDPGGGSCGGTGGLVTGAARMDAEGADAALCSGLPLCGRLVDCAVCPAGAVQALPALAGLGWDSGHGAGPGVELAGRAPCGGPDGVPAVFDGGTDLFRREGGAAAAHCFLLRWGCSTFCDRRLWRPGGEAGCPFCWRCSCLAGFAASSCCGRGTGRGAFPAWRPPCATGWRRPFYARPRSRALLAAPCVPLFLWACRRKVLFFQFFCGVGACLECVSVVNTFCHGVAPVGVSLIRSLLGAGLGLCLGLVAVAIAEGILRSWRAKGQGTLSKE